MTTAYLFSGADISGRDALLSRSAAPVVDLAKDALSRVTTTIFALALVAFTATPGALVRSMGDVGEVPLDIRDDAIHRAETVASDRTQPNRPARAQAIAVIEALRGQGLDPHRVVADPDGGVAVYVFGGARVAGALALVTRVSSLPTRALSSPCASTSPPRSRASGKRAAQALPQPSRAFAPSSWAERCALAKRSRPRSACCEGSGANMSTATGCCPRPLTSRGCRATGKGTGARTTL